MLVNALQLAQKATCPTKLPVPVETTSLAFDTKQDILWAGNKEVYAFNMKLTSRDE